MNKIDFKKVKTDGNLFREFERYMKGCFNTQITKEQFLNFVDLCEKKKFFLNPFQMCAWLLSKPVEVIVDRWYDAKRVK
ncbi:hypothetical protein [Streptococcus parasanguinis]|uniref:hypothetical protein n=1 Tax=Streptococcus parasanguinis TaxID=1318 RepID=UPI0020527CC0|nr:MAG TPA: hypothetical protein [Caudoviricetes sp.]